MRPLLAFLLHSATASAQEGTACRSTAADTVERAADTSRTARAYWLNTGELQWPGAPLDGRYVLYQATGATIRATVGARVTGAAGRMVLSTARRPTLPKIAERFRFVPNGARLSLPRRTRAQLRGLVQGQVVLVREDADQRVLDATQLQLPGILDELYAAATSVSDLGATLDLRGVGVAVWAPTARHVLLCVDASSRGDDAMSVPMRMDAGTGVWRARVPQAMRGRGYRYEVEVLVPGVGVVRNRVTDPYAVALTANSERSVFLSLSDATTRPPGWLSSRRPTPLRAATDQVVYELHVRDFSVGDSSVRAPWRGKYLAFTEPRSSGMRHLQSLGSAGLTDVHLLPVYDLASVPEAGCVTPAIPASGPESETQQAAVSAVREGDCFNWGYDPWHYTVPEGSYATDASDAATRIREFRAMVQALHSAGLRVGMDVVYNHTFAAGQSAKSVLDRLVPGYYHRLDSLGRIERSTCCENTATEHAMMAKLMIESVVTWVRHYQIDSFRFDLMGHQPRAVMERLQRAVDRAAGRHIPLLGEGWNFGEVADGARFVQASQRSLSGSGIATFTDRARDALRGGGCCDGREGLVGNQGLLNGLHLDPNATNTGKDQRTQWRRAADLARAGLAGTLRDYVLTGADGAARPLASFDYGGQPAGYVKEPGEVVNYVENHDNLTLFDVNALRLPATTSREQRARAQVLGIAFTLLSQGIAYLHAGVDILRSKSLDRDSFDSGDWFNRLDWSYTINGFGGGLPPAHRNRDDWSVMRPVLAERGIAPTPAEIAFTRDGTRDWLRIRASSSLFRLRTATDVRTRLRFLHTGPTVTPGVIVGHLEGRGYPGAGFKEVLYLFNVAPEERSVEIPEARGKQYVLHPVQRGEAAADRTAARSQVEPSIGRFTIPARTAVVFVIE